MRTHRPSVLRGANRVPVRRPRRRWGLQGTHLVSIDGARDLEIVDVGGDKVEVVDLAGTAQVGHAVAGFTRGGRRPAPTLDDLGRLGIGGSMSRLDQDPSERSADI